MTNGFYKRRRGLVEHIESGTIDLLENGIHDYLSLKANFVIGGTSSIPVGICFTSAPAIHAHCKRISERTIQRCLSHLEEIGWIKTFRTRNQRGNYPALICRASVHDLSGNEYRINGATTTDWNCPVYEPVGQLSPETSNAVRNVAPLREVRSEKEKNSLPIAEGFDRFWSIYPRKKGKVEAEKAWKKIKPEEAEAVLARVELNNLGEWKGCQLRFIPYPTTWLNGRRWEDELDKPGPVGSDAQELQRKRKEITPGGKAILEKAGGYLQ